jgi:DNA-binding transcriptional LysR family regulator
VTPLLRDEVFYASSDPARVAEPMTIERFSRAKLVLYDAHYGWTDPTRRQLLERAQLAGLKIEPWIEVEHVESALNMVARGIGDTMVCQAVCGSSVFPPSLLTVPFAEPLYDTIALVQRVNGLLSPGTRELAKLAQRMLIGARPPGATKIRGVVRKGARSERS